MAKQRQTQFRIGLLALVLAVPAVSAAQTPPVPGSVGRCTDAAPCVTPGARAKPGKIAPSPSAVREFRETHPCPTTGHDWGACPGYIVNHITPLCKGGRDVASNLEWQTHTYADRRDQKACR